MRYELLLDLSVMSSDISHDKEFKGVTLKSRILIHRSHVYIHPSLLRL